MSQADDLKAELGRLCAEVRRLADAQAETRAALAALTSTRAAPAATQPPESSVWRSAPLGTRLRFLAELLDEKHALHKRVREAESLVGLVGRGSELEDWLSSYPSLFVDSYSALLDGPSPGDAPALEVLARETLGAVREAVDRELEAFGVTWVAPAAGDAPGDGHVIAGAEPWAGVTPGAIARCARRGLRRRGRVLLPAQVYLARAVPPASSGGSESTAHHPAGEPETAPPTAAGSARLAVDGPEWLGALQRASGLESSPAVARPMAGLGRLVACLTAPEPAEDEAIRALAAPLLPLLGGSTPAPPEIPRTWAAELARARPDMEAWLRERGSLEVIAPAAGDGFDSGCMEAVSIRRTAHPHEQGLVAKLERPGLRRAGQTLIPARVVQYSSGDTG